MSKLKYGLMILLAGFCLQSDTAFAVEAVETAEAAGPTVNASKARLTYQLLTTIVRQKFNHRFGEAHWIGIVEGTGQRCSVYINITSASVIIRLFGTIYEQRGLGNLLELEITDPNEPRGSVVAQSANAVTDRDTQNISLNTNRQVNYLGKYGGTKAVVFHFEGAIENQLKVTGLYRSAMRPEGLMGWIFGERIDESSMTCVL